MNPNYDRPDHDDFRRRIAYDCFFCHNAYPSGTGRRFLLRRSGDNFEIARAAYRLRHSAWLRKERDEVHHLPQATAVHIVMTAPVPEPHGETYRGLVAPYDPSNPDALHIALAQVRRGTNLMRRRLAAGPPPGCDRACAATRPEPRLPSVKPSAPARFR